ncbi:MAG: hypothetical protein DRJ40_05200 [Thermoprotei archaeon]|nr:MAG: hypothetical protein DRJ40_04325 [Thermoprotei archaeon]RLE56794.1 MAG: hypothetical protein DRJ40_05200 [Thermoprotei archaeon]
MREYVVVKKDFSIKVPAVIRNALKLKPGTVMQIEYRADDHVLVLRPVAKLRVREVKNEGSLGR